MFATIKQVIEGSKLPTYNLNPEQKFTQSLINAILPLLTHYIIKCKRGLLDVMFGHGNQFCGRLNRVRRGHCPQCPANWAKFTYRRYAVDSAPYDCCCKDTINGKIDFRYVRLCDIPTFLHLPTQNLSNNPKSFYRSLVCKGGKSQPKACAACAKEPLWGYNYLTL